MPCLPRTISSLFALLSGLQMQTGSTPLRGALSGTSVWSSVSSHPQTKVGLSVDDSLLPIGGSVERLFWARSIAGRVWWFAAFGFLGMGLGLVAASCRAAHGMRGPGNVENACVLRTQVRGIGTSIAALCSCFLLFTQRRTSVQAWPPSHTTPAILRSSLQMAPPRRACRARTAPPRPPRGRRSARHGQARAAAWTATGPPACSGRSACQRPPLPPRHPPWGEEEGMGTCLPGRFPLFANSNFSAAAFACRVGPERQGISRLGAGSSVSLPYRVLRQWVEESVFFNAGFLLYCGSCGCNIAQRCILSF
jgi:hypothetical protein